MKEAFKSGYEFTLKDLIEGKWSSYPLMSVPDEETLDYEKIHEVLDCERVDIHEFVVLELMMRFGQVSVRGYNAPYPNILNAINEWVEFYRRCCDILGFDIKHHKIIGHSIDNLAAAMALKMEFYTKVKGVVYDSH